MSRPCVESVWSDEVVDQRGLPGCVAFRGRVLQQLGQFRTKVFAASHRLRGLSFGQDRYRRRYWALPHCGGVYLEALESAEPGFSEPVPRSPPVDLAPQPGGEGAQAPAPPPDVAPPAARTPPVPPPRWADGTWFSLLPRASCHVVKSCHAASSHKAAAAAAAAAAALDGGGTARGPPGGATRDGFLDQLQFVESQPIPEGAFKFCA